MNGNLGVSRFVLNSDFSEVELFGANTTDSVSGQEIVVGGTERSGTARGPGFQVWDSNGNFLTGRFVLTPEFTEVKFSKVDINSDGVDEIVVVGRESRGLQGGPAFQVYDGSGNLLGGSFVLGPDFSNLRVFVTDQDGDGNQELGIGGMETSGLMRGPAYQIWESNGTLLLGQFVLGNSRPKWIRFFSITQLLYWCGTIVKNHEQAPTQISLSDLLFTD